MSFDLDIGFTSERGPRTGNEDFALVRQPGPSDAAWGVIAALILALFLLICSPVVAKYLCESTGDMPSDVCTTR